MTFGTFLLLCSLLFITVAAIIAFAHCITTRRHPDPRGSIWQHIFKE